MVLDSSFRRRWRLLAELQNVRWPSVVLAAIILVAVVFYLWGIRRDLPYTPDVDEPVFMRPAVHIAATLGPNPHWFGNPGSTVIYPLALLLRIWQGGAHFGPLPLPDAGISAQLEANPGSFYLLGRLVTVTYAILSLPLIFLLGRLIFGTSVALAATWLTCCYAILVSHAQTLRTDSAAVFWGMLSLWFCISLYRRPTLRLQILTGLAIGLAISTRYFMVTVTAVLLAVNWLLYRRGELPADQKSPLRFVAAGLIAILVGFAVSSPFFFLDFQQAMASIQQENRATQLGADGLSRIGNLAWYLTNAIPDSLSTAQAILAALGGVLVLWKRDQPKLILMFFIAVFLLAISISRLHWQRWIIQIVPLLALLAAYALYIFLNGVTARIGRAKRETLYLVGIILLSAWPTYQVVRNDLLNARPSTRIDAREWIVANLPAGSQIGAEWYTAPLEGTSMKVTEQFSLAVDHTIEDYYSEGKKYLMVSSTMYDRYIAEPLRYAREIAFYENLFSRAHLLREFIPSENQRGPVIRVYELK